MVETWSRLTEMLGKRGRKENTYTQTVSPLLGMDSQGILAGLQLTEVVFSLITPRACSNTTAYMWLQSSLCHRNAHGPEEGRKVCLEQRGQGSEAKAVKEERPRPSGGQEQEHLETGLWEKLPDRQQ